MYVITVTPIKKNFGKESLSYFSANEVSPGGLISVPLRKGEVLALVLTCVGVREEKAELKGQDYALRKIGEVKSTNFGGQAWMIAVQRFAYYSAISVGGAVGSLVPKVVLENIENIKGNDLVNEREGSVEIFHGNTEERFSHYKSLIRDEFAKHKSVFLVVSTNEEIEEASSYLEKGIEKFVYVFSPKISTGLFKKRLKEIRETNHPILIVASAQWLCLSSVRGDIETVILEREASPSFRTMHKPFLDFRKFVEFYCEESSLKLVLGDALLSVETLWEYGGGSIKPHTVSVGLNVGLELVDIRGEKRSSNGDSTFTILSREVLELLRDTKENNKNMFVYATRKGLSAVTVCRDCGQEVLCHNCSSPVVLYKRADMNIFRCKQCGEVRNAQEVCNNCGGWRLTPLGVGVERIAEEIVRYSEVVGDIKIFEVNKEATPTHAKAKAVVDKFYKTPGSVLVGTEMALNLLNEQVDFSVIATIDSLFSIPDFRIRERIFHILLQARSLAREKFIIQARNAERETLNMALAGQLAEFYKREIKERETLKYPPFSTFVKVTVRGTKAMVLKEAELLSKIFERWNPVIFESGAERHEAPSAVNCVIKLGEGEYPKSSLYSTLLSLPPYFEIKINPDNLL